jgi:HAD superfamily phosphoserine phosphatase-like hydrolase
MERKKEVVIFDFCETLVNLQSADEFVHFIHLNNELPILNQWIYKIWKWSKMLRIISVYDRVFRRKPIEKKWLLYSLRELSEEFIHNEAQRYSEWLKTSINKNVWNQFELATVNSDLVIICSGGYENYLIPFFSEFNVQVIATKFRFKNQKFTGTINGLDCLGEEKVKRIEMSNGKDFWSKVEIDFYSDSITDMPLFKKSKRKIVAYKSKPPVWVRGYDFEVIKWKN